ncbi:hypothetical protein ACFVFI_26705 [Streptomyces sp. NPDC057705]|uniref:hypothetical protein n=1 Tax=Streptomyces sp. NPDC057705 TaxID=3346222 RepID=UPI00369BF994
MTPPRERTGLPEDQRFLRWALGIPLGLLHLLNAFFVYTAVRFGPAAEWDDPGYAGTTAMALFAVIFSVLGILITLVPPVRRTLGPWWFVPPVVLGAIAWIRMVTLG